MGRVPPDKLVTRLTFPSHRVTPQKPEGVFAMYAKVLEMRDTEFPVRGDGQSDGNCPELQK